MKYLFILFLLISLNSVGQPIKSGTYIFKYCDIEYNMCLSTCKVVIKGYSITIYAAKELAESINWTKKGDILEEGTLVKTKQGRWTIKSFHKNAATEEEFLDIDFKKREFWRF